MINNFLRLELDMHSKRTSKSKGMQILAAMRVG